MTSVWEDFYSIKNKESQNISTHSVWFANDGGKDFIVPAYSIVRIGLLLPINNHLYFSLYFSEHLWVTRKPIFHKSFALVRRANEWSTSILNQEQTAIYRIPKLMYKGYECCVLLQLESFCVVNCHIIYN